jgi:hypothetical protein
MLPQHPSIDRAGRHSDLSRQFPAQPRRVQERPTADDLRRRQARVRVREVSQDVDGVSDEQQDGGFFQGFHVADHAGEDGLVAADEVGAGFPWCVYSISVFNVLLQSHTSKVVRTQLRCGLSKQTKLQNHKNTKARRSHLPSAPPPP